jgi:subtilisin family serine protease
MSNLLDTIEMLLDGPFLNRRFKPICLDSKLATTLIAVASSLWMIAGATALAAEEHLVYDGALLRVQPGMRAYAALRSTRQGAAAEGFSSETLSGQVLHLKRFKRFSASTQESPVPFSRKTNPCRRATVRNALRKMQVPLTACNPNYALYSTATPNDPFLSSQWAPAAMSSASAWNTTTGTKNVTVVVIDTGISLSHPDLVDNLWVNPHEIAGDGVDNDGNGYIDDINGINSITNTGNPNDDNNHGTHVAGIIGARGNNGVGISGVNWRVSIAGAKFLDASGTGSTSNAIKCVQYATNLKRYGGQNVVATNNSWGGGGYSSALASAILDAASQNILFIAAAGNSALNLTTTASYPASYNFANMISVASTTSSSSLSSFSNYGASTVHLGAPGSNIYSTIIGGYASFSGTSMACPQVAGVAALASAMCSTPLSASSLKNILLSTGSPLPALNGKTVTGKLVNSLGAVNAAATLCATPPPATPTAAPTAPPPTSTPTALPTPTPIASTPPAAAPTPTPLPSVAPVVPTGAPPTVAPSPTALPATPIPTSAPILAPTITPTVAPTSTPTAQPTPAVFSITASPARLVKAGDPSQVSIFGAGTALSVPVSAQLRTWLDGQQLAYTCPTKRLLLSTGVANSTFSTPPSIHYFSSVIYSAALNSRTVSTGVSVATPRLAPPPRASRAAKLNLLAAKGSNFCGAFSRSIQAVNRRARFGRMKSASGL